MKKLLYIIFIFCNFLAFSQPEGYVHYTIEDGLSSNTIYFSMQDSKGFMWFATDNGVSRFNGNKFDNFSTSDGLLSNSVFNIVEDYKGRIWFISFNGQLSYFYNNKIHQYKYNNVFESTILRTPTHSSFYIDSLDNVYLSLFSIIYIVDSEGKFQIDTVKENTLSVYVINSNNVLMTTPNKYNKIEINKNGRKKIYSIENENHSHLDNINIVNDKIFIKTTKYIYTILDNEIKKISTNNILIYYLLIKKNNIWLGSNKGVIIFSMTDNKITHSEKTLLKNYKISAITHNNDNSVWFTTLKNGVFYKSFSQINEYNSKLPNTNIKKIKINNNNIYIGTYAGVYFIIKEGGSIQKEEISNKVLEITDIEFINDTPIIIVPKGLYNHYDKKIFYKSYSNTIKEIKFINNTIFTANRTGLFYIDKNKVYKKIFTGWSNTIFNLNDSIILVGTRNSVIKVNINTLVYNELISGYNFGSINKFNNVLLLGTKNNGIIVKKDTFIKHLTIRNGLSSNVIRDIVVYKNYIWIATNKGVNLINLNNSNILNPEIQSFYNLRGVSSNIINDLCIKDSLLLIGSNKGVSYINMNKFIPREVKSSIYITKIKVNDNDTSLLPLFNLNYNENELYIEYLGVFFSHSSNIRYKYRFQTKNAKIEWKYTENTSIYFPQLKTGNYIFEVYSIINNVESNASKKIEFVIHKPFWQKNIFKILVFILVVIIAGIVVVVINTQYRKKNKKKAALHKYQQQALINQINPHFIFNTLNSIQLYIYKNERIKSAEYITMFSQLMRQVLDNSKKELVSIQEEKIIIEHYVKLEQLRFEKKFDFKLTVDNKLLYYKVIPLVTQPFIENAIWHGLMLKEGNGLLEVFIYEHNNEIIIAIDDNGIGREKAQKIGSKLSEKRESHGNDIGTQRLEVFNNIYKKKASIEIRDIITDGEIGGTRVLIKFPKMQ